MDPGLHSLGQGQGAVMVKAVDDFLILLQCFLIKSGPKAIYTEITVNISQV